MGKVHGVVPAFPQVGVQVLPTRSIYDFDDGHVHVTLTFLTPALPDDLEVLARPLTYLTWEVRSVDGDTHAVSVFESTSSLMAVNTADQKVVWDRVPSRRIECVRVGTVDQTLLQPAGDDTRIDWGYLYAAAPATHSTAVVGSQTSLDESFTAEGTIPSENDAHSPSRQRR